MCVDRLTRFGVSLSPFLGCFPAKCGQGPPADRPSLRQRQGQGGWVGDGEGNPAGRGLRLLEVVTESWNREVFLPPRQDSLRLRLCPRDPDRVWALCDGSNAPRQTTL